MKRFYRDVAVANAYGGWTVTLDSKAVRTPGRAALVVPTAALAEGIAAEWSTRSSRQPCH